MKVLLVDDDRTMQAILKTLLEIEQYQVVVWDGHSQLHTLIGQEQPDVVILDVYLRDLNGLDVIRQVRADTASQHVKVVMTSGMALKEECLAAGANAFLLKPYMPDELLDLLIAV